MMMELLLDNTHEGLVLCDNSGKILYFNKPYADIFRLSKEKDVGRNIREIFPDARIPIVAQTGIPDFGVVYHWEGQKVIVNRVPFRNGVEVGGVITQVLFRDIQELNKMNDKLHFLKSRIEGLNNEFRNYFQAKYSPDDILGENYRIRQLKKLATKYAQTSLPVLVLGESGTGKELFAHTIHQTSPRAQMVFIVINCAAMPAGLIESELFGYEKGAFTGANQKGRIGKIELAEGGTLFIDEIGDMPYEMQAKMLRVLEDKEVVRLGGVKPNRVDFRLVAATNRNIEEMVRQGTFRADLYYRLSTFLLNIPPLRERPEDIAPIAEHLASNSECNFSGKPIRISARAMACFRGYEWPGNFRELKNVVHSAVSHLAEDETVIDVHQPAALSG